jgi:hypothetical protein
MMEQFRKEQGRRSDPTQAWKPSFKFKVKDKELEFDDFVKPIIKTKDLEQKFKDLYEKAHGLDEVKTSRETFKQQVKSGRASTARLRTVFKLWELMSKKATFVRFFKH